MTKENYQELCEKALYHSKLYYDLDAPEISDYDFDMLMQEIKKAEAEHPEWVTPDSPTQKVGGTVSKTELGKLDHPVPLLSLRDVFSMDDVAEWWNNSGNPETTVETKVDGLSLAIHYENGKFVRAATRGNGNQGELCSENAKHIGGIPMVIPELTGYENKLIVRAEVYMPVSEFERLNNELEKEGKKLFANPRNAAAGSLRTKDAEVTGQRGLRALAFNIMLQDGITGKIYEHEIMKKQSEDIEALYAMGFEVVSYFKCKDLNEIDNAIKKIQEMKSTLPYWIDGAVVKTNDIAASKALGGTNKVPHGQVAYKYPPEEQETVVKEVVLQTGRTGRVTPVVIFEPVFLAGTKVQKATLHNPQKVEELGGISINDHIIVRKAAEIVPEVLKVIPQKSADRKPIEFISGYDGNGNHVYRSDIVYMDKCPSCGDYLVSDEDGNGLYCANPLCPAQKTHYIEFFASKPCMNIEGMGPAMVELLVEKGLIDDVPSIYNLEKYNAKELNEKTGMGEKTAKNLLASIAKSKNVDIPNLIKSLGISGIGQHIGKTLAKMYPDMDAIATLTKEELLCIDGIGDISAVMMSEYFHSESGKKTIERLKAAGLNMISKSYGKTIGGIFYGKKFVITGTLPTMSRDEAKKFIEGYGGTTSDSVSKKVDYLVAGEATGSKLEKAKSLGVPVITEEMLKKMAE